MAGKTVTLKLDRERHLRYDLNAIAEIGDKLELKVRLDRLGEDLAGTPLPLRAFRTILWAGLVHEDKELTEEKVGELVDQDNIGTVFMGFLGLFGNISPGALDVMRAKLSEAAGVELPELEATTT